jgi:hypothetical protein
VLSEVVQPTSQIEKAASGCKMFFPDGLSFSSGDIFVVKVEK